MPVFAWNWKEKITIPLVLEKLSTIIFCDLSQQRSALIFSKDILVHMLLMNKRLFWYGIWIEITVQFSNIKCINTCHPQFYQPAILCLSWWNSAYTYLMQLWLMQWSNLTKWFLLSTKSWHCLKKVLLGQLYFLSFIICHTSQYLVVTYIKYSRQSHLVFFDVKFICQKNCLKWGTLQLDIKLKK